MRLSNLLLATVLLMGCGGRPEPEVLSTRSSEFPPVDVDVEARRPAEQLSDYRLFRDHANLAPNEGVIPYEVNSSHFVDGGESQYFLRLPAAAKVVYSETGVLDFPVGTVLVQHITFPYGDDDLGRGGRPIETRLLIHQTKGWVAVPYLWNASGTDADRVVIGARTPVTQKGEGGEIRFFEFITPDMNECKRCHKQDGESSPLGVTAANLNRTAKAPGNTPESQLDSWAQKGLLEGLPSSPDLIPKGAVWNDPSSASLEVRARTWLEVNCGSCHNPRGEAITSGLDLSLSQTHAAKFGVYKPPVAAGRGSGGYRFGIEPRKPERSFLLHRIRSLDPGVMMPPLGRNTIDEEGARVIEEWISGMQVDAELEAMALNPMEAYRPALDGGDAGRGKTVFYEKFKCVVCHTVESKGEGNVGPNLSDVGARLDREKILESIVDPGASIAQGYQTTLVLTEDEDFYSGILLSEDANEISLSNMTGGSDVIPKAAIVDRRTSDVSSMPTAANLLSVEEVRDLVQYLSERVNRLD